MGNCRPTATVCDTPRRWLATADWLAATFFALLGAYFVVAAIVGQRRRAHLRPVILAGYDRLLPADRAFFDHAVREPAPISERQLLIGYVGWLVPMALACAAGAQAAGGSSDGWFSLVFVSVCAAAGAAGGTWYARRRSMGELLGEPRPIGPLPPSPPSDAESHQAMGPSSSK